MQIGIDASRANSNERTGIENYSLQIILGLTRKDKVNKYILYVREDPIPEFEQLPSNFEIKILKSPRWWCRIRKLLRLPQIWTHMSLRAELRSSPVDLLFVPGHVLPLGYGGKSVVVIHDVGFQIVPEVYSLWQRLYQGWSTRQAIKQASKLVTVSLKTKQDLVDIYKADEAKIKMIYPGFDKKLFGKAKKSDIKSLLAEFKIDTPYFLFIGNIIPKKGLTELIKAYGLFAYREYSQKLKRQELQEILAQKDGEEKEEMDSQSENIILVIAGKGDQKFVDGLSDLAGECLVKDKVKFTGYLDQEKLALLLAGAMAYVQPSLYEGFGLPVLEAMASKVPVIVSDSGAMLEVVEDCGRVVKAGDQETWAEAMHELATEPNIRNEMQKMGLERIRKFDWDEAAGKFVELFQALGD